MKLSKKIFFSLAILCLSLCDSQILPTFGFDKVAKSTDQQKTTSPEQAQQRSWFERTFGKKPTPKVAPEVAPKPAPDLISSFNDDDDWVNVDEPNPADEWDAIPEQPPNPKSKETIFNNFDQNHQFSPAELQQIRNLDVLNLTEQGIRNLSTHVNFLTLQQIKDLNKEQLQALSKDQIQNLTTDQLRSLTLNQIPNFKFHDLTDEQMQKLFSDQDEKFNKLEKLLQKQLKKIQSKSPDLTKIKQKIKQTREELKRALMQQEKILRNFTSQQLAQLSPAQLQISIDAITPLYDLDEKPLPPMPGAEDDKLHSALYNDLKNSKDLSKDLQNKVTQQAISKLPTLTRFELFLKLKS